MVCVLHVHMFWPSAYGPLAPGRWEGFRSCLPTTSFPPAYGGRHLVAREVTLLESSFTGRLENPKDGPFCRQRQPHAQPPSISLVVFRDSALIPSPCLPLWSSTRPLSSGRCTWGAMYELCQELEWSLYRLAFNVPPVSSCAIVRKTTIIAVMIYSPLIVASPCQTMVSQPGGLWCSISIRLMNQRPHPPPPAMLYALQRHKLHVTSRQDCCSDGAGACHHSFQWNYCKIKLLNWEEREYDSAQPVIATSLA